MKEKAKTINNDFFKTWSRPMAYVLGYFIADGCVGVSKGRKNPHTFNITSKDLNHLGKIKKTMGSTYKISRKFGSNGNVAYQIQIRNEPLCRDIIRLGVLPRKTYNLEPVKVPQKYFADFVRGFFDGDGTVYIYSVNNVPQIKAGFVCASRKFIGDLSHRLCKMLTIPEKKVHETVTQGRVPMYSLAFYIDDCEKFSKFIYHKKQDLYLDRKKEIFDAWENVKRRGYIKRDYPSKVGWHLNRKSFQTV
jgi:LAGLIDADG-like domain